MDATTMENRSMINGVDVDRLFATIDAIKDEGCLAAFRFRARNRWIDGGENRTTVDDYHGAGEDHRRVAPFVLVNDEPPVLLGEDRGANPVEHVLHALAGCLTTSLVFHAAARGVRIDEVETRFEGDLDVRGFLGMKEDVRNGYQAIRVTFHVTGDASEAELAELIALAQKRSPVFDIVSNGVPVMVSPHPVPSSPPSPAMTGAGTAQPDMAASAMNEMTRG